jgi:hypothetical protein
MTMPVQIRLALWFGPWIVCSEAYGCTAMLKFQDLPARVTSVIDFGGVIAVIRKVEGAF